MKTDAITRLRVEDQVYRAFDKIETEQLTLRQIADQRLFPPNWCFVMGWATRRRAGDER